MYCIEFVKKKLNFYKSMSICYKKHNKNSTDMCFDPYIFREEVNADGWHYLVKQDKSDIPVIPDDGGMTPHTLRQNPSLMVTGVNIDVTSSEHIEDELERLSSQIENIESNTVSND